MATDILFPLDKGSTCATICNVCNSKNFIRVRDLVHNIRVCEECTHTCKGSLRNLIGEHACIPCIIDRIIKFISFCMINENTISPSKIEGIVEGWVSYPHNPKNLSTSIVVDVDNPWEDYWNKLCEDGIVTGKGDMYGWLQQLGKVPDLISDGNMSYNCYDECYQDDIDRSFYVICQSYIIKKKMQEGVCQGKKILTKRANLKMKYLSLISYVLDKREKRYPGLHNIFRNMISSYVDDC